MYSFIDLFKAANDRLPTQEEAKSFITLPREKRNADIKQWVKAAGWETRNRTGTDGNTYLSFAPNFKD